MSMPSQAELLEQFVLEARECLERIGQRLLDVERSPRDGALLDDLFRSVHTLKGNCGLFEFGALERVVHAAEDVLDQVRAGRLAYEASIADALLEAVDFAATLVDAIEAAGGLPAAAEPRAAELAATLRRHLEAPRAERAPRLDGAAGPAAAAASAAPDWVSRVPLAERARGRLVVRYRPEPECFFKGEDPWRLALELPGLCYLDVAGAEPWDAGGRFDCYRCNLDIVAVSEAARAAIDEHFRYVPEQLETWALTDEAPPPLANQQGTSGVPAADEPSHRATQVLAVRTAQLWADQIGLLEHPGVAPSAVAAARVALAGLLRCWPQAAASGDAAAALADMPVPEAGAAALAAWARGHLPAEQAAAAAGLVRGAGADEAEDPPGAVNHALGAASAAAGRADPPAFASAEADSGAERGARVLKVAQDKVDRLMDLIGEMVVAKNALPYLADRAESMFGQRELAREIKAQYAVINRIAEEMQQAIMQVRMMPVGTVFQRFSRIVRDVGRKLGKEVQLVVEGADTEADKNVIEALADPLVHVVRNSLDHGIETPERRRAAGKAAQGTLRLSARQESDRVILEVADDGAGINTARVRAKAVERGLIPAERAASLTEAQAAQLVFLPGFSTAEAITDLSGRGVGMDVVRCAVERVGGSVELASVAGRGTTVTLSLPLSMAVTHVMLIEVAGGRFGVPMDAIVETVRVHAEDIHHFKQAQAMVLRERIVPLCSLHELLGLESQPRANPEGEHAVLVVRLGNEHLGLLVDDFAGTCDIILKPLEGVLAGLGGFAGTALMGDGSVLMVLNPKGLH